MITFQEEPWAAIRGEVSALWQQHYDEIAEDKDLVPLDPDWDKYDALANLGKLVIVTARRERELVGYVFSVVDTHLHYKSTLFSMSDIYWLDRAHRGGRTALRLFQAAERVLAGRGVVKMLSNTKLAHDQGRLFGAMGWREAERLFVKTIGA
jgi:hypothetical protein